MNIDPMPIPGRYTRHALALLDVTELLWRHVNNFFLLIPMGMQDGVQERDIKGRINEVASELREYMDRTRSFGPKLSDSVYAQQLVELAGCDEYEPLEDLAALVRFAQATLERRWNISPEEMQARAASIASGETAKARAIES